MAGLERAGSRWPWRAGPGRIRGWTARSGWAGPPSSPPPLKIVRTYGGSASCPSVLTRPRIRLHCPRFGTLALRVPAHDNQLEEKLMKIRPLQDRVIVKRVQEEEK